MFDLTSFLTSEKLVKKLIVWQCTQCFFRMYLTPISPFLLSSFSLLQRYCKKKKKLDGIGQKGKKGKQINLIKKEQNQFVCNCNLSPMFTKDKLKRLTGLTWRSKHK